MEKLKQSFDPEAPQGPGHKTIEMFVQEVKAKF